MNKRDILLREYHGIIDTDMNQRIALQKEIRHRIYEDTGMLEC